MLDLPTPVTKPPIRTGPPQAIQTVCSPELVTVSGYGQVGIGTTRQAAHRDLMEKIRLAGAA